MAPPTQKQLRAALLADLLRGNMTFYKQMSGSVKGGCHHPFQSGVAFGLLFGEVLGFPESMAQLPSPGFYTIANSMIS